MRLSEDPNHYSLEAKPDKAFDGLTPHTPLSVLRYFYLFIELRYLTENNHRICSNIIKDKEFTFSYDFITSLFRL